MMKHYILIKDGVIIGQGSTTDLSGTKKHQATQQIQVQQVEHRLPLRLVYWNGNSVQDRGTFNIPDQLAAVDGVAAFTGLPEGSQVWIPGVGVVDPGHIDVPPGQVLFAEVTHPEKVPQIVQITG